MVAGGLRAWPGKPSKDLQLACTQASSIEPVTMGASQQPKEKTTNHLLPHPLHGP